MKINIRDTDKIVSVLAETEGRATERKVSAQRIGEMASWAENKLRALNTPKKDWIDCCVISTPPKVCNSYKYIAEGTTIRITRFPTGWFLTLAARVMCGKITRGDDRRTALWLSKTAKAALPGEYIL